MLSEILKINQKVIKDPSKRIVISDSIILDIPPVIPPKSKPTILSTSATFLPLTKPSKFVAVIVPPFVTLIAITDAFTLTVAAAEAAIGLAIIVVYYRNSSTIRVEEINSSVLAGE